jgi:hypothetical protein
MIEIGEEYAKYEEETPKFEDIEPKLSSRPDLHAFILLNQLLPGTSDMVSAAEHDQIWLDVDLDELSKVATPDHIKQLAACHVWYDGEYDALYMFV